jgi:hypothetical protein
MWVFALILLLLWTAGVVNGFTLGGVIHVLLGLAIVMLFLRLYRGTHVALPQQERRTWNALNCFPLRPLN